ncbi:PREDICTED: uncharacterized protein LOC109212467 [Nicotiana attenuata]|uniref:uncharacterized protein LOC109212467 n=1 Tax=Nicotiana attenuata TaxID=49451 RepID=UPI00090554FD|nr:PREDICTED: uncharacterized protein LOC109212467 [Nicotiana attenuata]
MAEVFVAFVKKIQVKMESKVICIRSDHGTEFDNVKFYDFCNENDQLGKFDAKSDEGIFLGYSSQSKAYKIYNKRTQYVEESVHVIFDESHPSFEKNAEEDQDVEPLLVPGKVINMTNGKADMMSEMKEANEDNVASSSTESSTSITTTKAEERVVDVVQGTPLASERRIEDNQPNIPSSSQNEPQSSNSRHQKPKNIKEALKDVDWITAMQDELHQFERNGVRHLVPRPPDRTIIGTSILLCSASVDQLATGGFWSSH